MKRFKHHATLYFLTLFVPLIYMWTVWIVIPAFAQGKDWEPRVQILIHAKTVQGDYNDAIYVSQSEYDKLAKEDIDKQVQTRVDNWLKFVAEQSSKPPVEPTKEDLLVQQEQLQSQIDALVAKVIANKDTAKADLSKISASLKATAATIDSAASVK